MRDSYDMIYLSPHFDDVALSCGGQIWQQTTAGQSVLVVTVTAGEPPAGELSPFAADMHAGWGQPPETIIATRRDEDILACRRLGADVLHLSLRDCIYRAHPESGAFLYASEEAIFGQVAASEGPLPDALAKELSRLPSAGAIVGPLAVGNHIDHQLTRAAAERCFGDALVYYEDYPYAQRHPDGVAQATQPAGQWRAKLIPLSDAAVEARYEAIMAYSSQLTTIFEEEPSIWEQLTNYIKAVGGERRWHRTGKA